MLMREDDQEAATAAAQQINICHKATREENSTFSYEIIGWYSSTRDTNAETIISRSTLR